MPRRFARSIAVLGAVLFATARASAYCQGSTCDTASCPVDENNCKTTGRPVAWKNGVIGMSLQRDGTAEIDIDDVRTVFESSLATWTGIACDTGTASIAFVSLRDAVCARAEQNQDGPNANIVMFTDKQRASSSKVHGAIDANTLGLTTRTYDVATGEIVGADIQINTADADFAIDGASDKYDLQSVLTHELGHVLGLDHWSDSSSVMFGEFDVGETRQQLTQDELDAACTIYPPDRTVTGSSDGTPPGGFSTLCATTTVPAATAETGAGCATRERGDASMFWAFSSVVGAAIGRRLRRRLGPSDASG